MLNDFYRCKESRIRKPAPFICSPKSHKLYVTHLSNVSSTSPKLGLQASLYNTHDTECAVKIKELCRNFWNYICLEVHKIRNFKN